VIKALLIPFVKTVNNVTGAAAKVVLFIRLEGKQYGKTKRKVHKMKIIIGTKNPAKINAVQTAFDGYQAEFVTMNVASGVSEQPFSDEETINGAVNRALNALHEGEGDMGIGLEGGVQKHGNGLYLCNWGALAVKGKEPFVAGGARIPLPKEIANRLIAGEELGPVMDEYTHKENIRKQEGAVGVFSNGRVDRAEMFSHVMKLLIGQYEYRSR
jgi:inosine/xanthosine triphosphatase